jgi:hypothetical protein
MTLPVHSLKWVQSRRPNEGVGRLPAQSLRICDHVARVRHPLGDATRIRHLGARRCSIKMATSCISFASSSSASSAATSARSVSFRRSAAAASRMDFRIASDRLNPEASSVSSARWTSPSIRTDTALVIGSPGRSNQTRSCFPILLSGKWREGTSPSRSCRTGRDSLVSGRGESHPPALAGPDVKLSPHPAPTGRLLVRGSICQWAKRLGWC